MSCEAGWEPIPPNDNDRGEVVVAIVAVVLIGASALIIGVHLALWAVR